MCQNARIFPVDILFGGPRSFISLNWIRLLSFLTHPFVKIDIDFYGGGRAETGGLWRHRNAHFRESSKQQQKINNKSTLVCARVFLWYVSYEAVATAAMAHSVDKKDRITKRKRRVAAFLDNDAFSPKSFNRLVCGDRRRRKYASKRWCGRMRFPGCHP